MYLCLHGHFNLGAGRLTVTASWEFLFIPGVLSLNFSLTFYYNISLSVVSSSGLCNNSLFLLPLICFLSFSLSYDYECMTFLFPAHLFLQFTITFPIYASNSEFRIFFSFTFISLSHSSICFLFLLFSGVYVINKN